MKSPHVLTVILVAAALALLGFFAAGLFQADSATVAISLFIGALIAPFIGKKEGDESPSTDVKTLYVGNLPYRANESSVRELFSQHGNVHSVRLMKDKHTGKRRGFGFVEISAEDAEAAVSSLNDTEFQQRTLKVREAKDRPDRVVEDI
ncbi:MAG: RNA-binding protein [Colwellia sp.]|nr:RNA-binding protein [Colwellia sp.]